MIEAVLTIIVAGGGLLYLIGARGLAARAFWFVLRAVVALTVFAWMYCFFDSNLSDRDAVVIGGVVLAVALLASLGFVSAWWRGRRRETRSDRPRPRERIAAPPESERRG